MRIPKTRSALRRVVEVPVPVEIHSRLVVFRESDPIWSKDADAVGAWAKANAGAIVWAEPPADFDAGWLIDVLVRAGCTVKQVAGRKADRVVAESVAEVAAPSTASIRDVVVGLCSERAVPSSLQAAVRAYCEQALESEGA